MPTTLTINAKDTPRHVKARIIGAIPGVNSTCKTRVDKLDGTAVVAERVVTDTIVENNITYFDVGLTLTEAALLLIGKYRWSLEVESVALDAREEAHYILDIGEGYVAQ